MKHLRSIEKGEPGKIKPRPESSNLDDFDIEAGKEIELKKITKLHLENLSSKEIEERESSQKKLTEFLKTAPGDQKEYAEDLRRLFGLQKRDWARLGFKTERVEEDGKEEEIPSILAEDGEEMSASKSAIF